MTKEADHRPGVLLVDDDERLLVGLVAALRGMRDSIRLHTAVGAAAALELLAQGDFDLIVTDMSMPGMNGAQLLGRVADEHPHVIRMFLSGGVDRSVGVQSTAISHRFLMKPCDPEQLIQAVESALQARHLLGRRRLRKLAGAVGALPSPPGIFEELSRALDAPTSSTKTVARVLMRDPALCGVVLKTVNSAYFGLPRSIDSIEEAVTRLGFSVVRSLVLHASLCAGDPSRVGAAGLSIDRLQRHAVATANASARLAGQASGRSSAFTAGLLSTVGLTVLALRTPDELRKTLSMARDQARPLVDVQREVLGAAYPEVGGFLLGAWGLPAEVVQAVVRHREPPAEGIELSHVVHIADLASRRAVCSPMGLADAEIAPGLLRRLELPPFDQLCVQLFDSAGPPT